MCSTGKLQFFKLFIAAAEIAAALGPFSMTPFPRIVSAELNPAMGLRSSSYSLTTCFFQIAYNSGYGFQTEEQSVDVMSSARSCFVLQQNEEILFKLYCLGYYSSLAC